MKEATHTDEFGNFYKLVGDSPKRYCVFYWHKSLCKWCQDLGIDFSHLVKIEG